MKCPRCRKEIQAEALFCAQCGLDLRENREAAEETNDAEQEPEETGDSFDDFAQAYGNPYADDAYENAYGNGAYEEPYGSNPYGEIEDEWDPYADILKKKQEQEQEEADEKAASEEEESAEDGRKTPEAEENASEEESSKDSVKEILQWGQEELKKAEQPREETVERIAAMSSYMENASSEKIPEKKKGGGALLFLLLVAAVCYVGYRQGAERGMLTGRNTVVAEQQKEEKPQTAENIGEPEERSEPMTEEEAIQINYLPENTETAEEPPVQIDFSTSGNDGSGDELFPVTVKEEMNMDEPTTEAPTPMPTPALVPVAAILDEMPPVDSSKRIEVISAYATSVIAQEGTSNEPIKVFDQKIDTNWQEGVSGPGIGQGFTAEFRNSEKVRYLAFMLGNWKTDRYYHGNNRPKTLTLELGDFKTQITFPDEWKEFYVEISPACEASALSVIIDEVYAGSSWDDTPITDISLFRE